MDQSVAADRFAQLSGLERLRAWVTGERAFEGLFLLLGFEAVAAEPGRAVFAVTPAAEHYNHGGSVHGGFIATLLDTAMGCAAQTVTAPGQFVTTMELKISYHRRITLATGRLEAAGSVLSHGKRAAFTEGRVTDGAGNLLASGSSTLMILERQRAPR
jgi:uncharacterized protein (TIGR00369 family)